MSQSDSAIESRLDELATRLAGVERRLAALERGGAAVSRPGDGSSAPDEPAVAIPGAPSGAELLSLSGRTLVVLGGAFLLRAVTEGGFVPQIAGAALGVAYAVLWLVLADRAAARGARASATFHGLVACAIAFPLVGEATVKFGFLTASTAMAALAIVTVAGLVVASRRGLGGVASLVVLGAAGTALALAGATSAWSLYVSGLLALAIATIALGYRRGWLPLAWTLAALVDATVLLMTLLVLKAGPERVGELFGPGALLAIQLVWVAGFVLVLGQRKLSTGDELTIGEIVSGVAVLLVGFGGATAVTRSTPVSGLWLGVVGLALAIGSYGVAFAVADRALHRRRGFIVYSSVALFVAIVASVAVLHGAGLTAVFCAGALVTAVLGFRLERATLTLHGAVYVVAAAVSSGLIADTYAALVGDAAEVPTPRWQAMLVLATACVVAWYPVATHGRTWGRFSRAPRVVVLTLLALGASEALVALLAPVLPEGAAPLLPSLRTAALAAAAVAAAWLGRGERFREAAWLVYPLLVLGGVKLVAQDLPAGRALTLFLSLGLYGAALIVAPRLARRAG